MIKKIFFIIIITLLILVSQPVRAGILPLSYYSNVNSNNQAYRTDLFLTVDDTYCANNPNIWSVNVTADINATCYLTSGSKTFWRVQLTYQTPLPGNTTSVELTYSRGRVTYNFVFNPFQFTVFDRIKQITFPGGESVFIMQPSFIRSIVLPGNNTYYQAILMQETGFNTSKTYYLKLLDPATNSTLNTFKSEFYNFYNTYIVLFMSSNTTKSGVYDFQIYDDSNNLIGEFISYMGSYYINSDYLNGIYIFRDPVIIDNNFYIRIKNNNQVPVNITGVQVTVLNNYLQTIINLQSNTSFTLNSGENKFVYLGQINTTQFDELTTGENIITVTVYYIENGEVKFKKITRQLTVKDISYSTTTSGYVRLDQINLIYPRPVFTMYDDNFQTGSVNLTKVPLIFLFVEYDTQTGNVLTVDSVSISLHPINGGTATVTGVYRTDQIYTSTGLPVGVYKAYVNYTNIQNGVIPVVGTVTIYAHYYIWFLWFSIPIYITLEYPIEFVINTKNIEQAEQYVSTLSTPIYTQLSTLKDNFKTYDYFWIAYSKDTDAGITGHFYDYYNTAGDTFPVTDIAQNPKVLVTTSQNNIQIVFDSALKKFFNYNNMEAIIMNNKGILREDITYTMNDTVIGTSNATEVTINLETGMRVMNSTKYFEDAYQTSGFILLRHQIYNTIIPFTVLMPFSVYYDDGTLTILNKAQSYMIYYPNVSDTNTYYLIPPDTYRTDLPIGGQPAVYYNYTYYLINPNFNFTPKIIGTSVYPTYKSINDLTFLNTTQIYSVYDKTLYDYALLQLFPLKYKSLLLKPGEFYTYSFTNTTITGVTFNTTTIQPQIISQYKFMSYTITKYYLPQSPYPTTINLTADNILNYTTKITYSNNTIVYTHLLLPNILEMSFLRTLTFAPSLYNDSTTTVITIYDPVLAPTLHQYAFMLNNIQITPLLTVRSPTHITLYYSGSITGYIYITIDGNPLILVAPEQ